MTVWIPDLGSISGPRYLAFVAALDADIAGGVVKPGMRLLPQRDMAQQLGLSVGTVSKAYAEAEQRGLVLGEVGRGTFVQRRPQRRTGAGPSESSINLALNVPPYTGEDDMIAATIAGIAESGALADLLGYLPHQGLRRHRDAMASWLGSLGNPVDPERVFITHGGQHALSIVLGIIARPNDTVLTESFTYSGMFSLSIQNSYRLHGVETDGEGLVPESLDRAFTETGARVVYCMPTIQTPTGAVMSIERRKAVADVVRRHNAFLVEDDAYAFLPVPPLPPVASFAPDNSFYVLSFAKCLAPGLRIAALIAPDTFRDRCINGIRAAGWMAVPLMAEVVARLIANGGLARQARLKRDKAVLRDAIVRRVLAEWLPAFVPTPGFHVWLPLPAGRTLNALVTQAAQAGITLAPPGSLQRMQTEQLGIRICLGAPATEDDLEQAVVKIRSILVKAESVSFV